MSVKKVAVRKDILVVNTSHDDELPQHEVPPKKSNIDD